MGPSDHFSSDSYIPGSDIVITDVKNITSDGVYVVPSYIDGKRVVGIMSLTFSGTDARKVSEACKDTVIMGTVGYASPEQLGVTQSDARTDIYAAGVLLNVMLTGFHPSERIVRGKQGRIVRKCTAIHPDDRYHSAEMLSKAL